jgi:1-acyl-sn-glycerol-3-phosphate acyltransferase
MTEASPGTHQVADADVATTPAGSVGRLLPGTEARIVDPATGELRAEREVGELQLRGTSVTPGYYRNPEATRTLFQGEWVNTGDRAYLSEGQVYITGREKDIIIRGGRNISPYELEEAVGDLPGVRRGCVAVFGSLDPANGTERVVVLAETREPDSSRHGEIRTRINELALGLIGAPVDDIVLAPPHTGPKTSSGKIRRVAAREYYERGPSAVRPQAVWLQLVRLGIAGIAPQLRRAWRVLRDLGFVARAYAVFAPCMLVAFLAAAFGSPRFAWNTGRAMARAFLWLSGVPVVVHGLENLPATPAVITPNHGSYMDGLVLMSVLKYNRYAYVAKGEFLGNWIMKTFLGGLGAVFVERFDVQKSAEHADELVAAARRGISLILFPEGTFRHHAGLLPFRTGAFQVAAQAGIPAVPVGLRGVRSLLREGTWYLRRATVTVSFGEPVMPDGSDWNAAVRLRDKVRAEILRRCGEPDLD